eukprot:11988984-Ditylum_brightwellii.AAC.1
MDKAVEELKQQMGEGSKALADQISSLREEKEKAEALIESTKKECEEKIGKQQADMDKTIDALKQQMGE